MTTRGPDLQRRRARLGLSREDVAAGTRIPVAHIAAIEEDRAVDLPEGPWAAAYARTLTEFLGQDSEEEALSPQEFPAVVPPGGAPLWVPRAMAFVSVAALLALLGSAIGQRLRPDPAAEPLPILPDQQLEVTARRSTRLKVEVDGVQVLDRAVSGGEALRFEALDQIAVSLPAIADVQLLWNGENVVPLGRQDAPRRLVFVDDGGRR